MDIYRWAKLYIDEHGRHASAYATTKAEAMLARGDLEGAGVWKRIVRAILEIQVTNGRTKH
jgi:hypothetical protein